jgi:hypothetical protein
MLYSVGKIACWWEPIAAETIDPWLRAYNRLGDGVNFSMQRKQLQKPFDLKS